MWPNTLRSMKKYNLNFKVFKLPIGLPSFSLKQLHSNDFMSLDWIRCCDNLKTVQLPWKFSIVHDLTLQTVVLGIDVGILNECNVSASTVQDCVICVKFCILCDPWIWTDSPSKFSFWKTSQNKSLKSLNPSIPQSKLNRSARTDTFYRTEWKRYIESMKRSTLVHLTKYEWVIEH